MAGQNDRQRRIVTATLAVAGIGASALFMKSCFSAFLSPTGKTTRLIKKHQAEFEVKDGQAVEITKAFSRQLEIGLQRDTGTSLKMIPSWLTALPTGEEQGEFYAIDIGGTNLRLVHCLFGTGLHQVLSHERREIEIPPSRKKGKVQNLFDFVVATFVIFLQHMGKPWQGKTLKIGFCFSFPFKSETATSGCIQQLTKGYAFVDAVGQDPVKLLKDTFDKSSDVKAEICVVCNDTVGVLAAGMYAEARTEMGVVLGTGTNASCVETVENIPKWVPGLPTDCKVPVNLEWGAFYCDHFPSTQPDSLLDSSSHNPGEYLFEKMISGESVGELCRLVLVSLSREGVFLKPQKMGYLTEPYSLTSVMVSEICSDASPELSRIVDVLKSTVNVNVTSREMEGIRSICDMVTDRAAILLSCAMAATIAHLHQRRNPPSTDPIFVSIDGSLYIKFEKMRRLVKQETQRMLSLVWGSKAPKFEIMPYNGASAFGAAALAAAVSPAADSVDASQFPEIQHLDH